MERLNLMMAVEKQHGKTPHVIFETHDPKEEAELELEFRRITGTDSHGGYLHRLRDAGLAFDLVLGYAARLWTGALRDGSRTRRLLEKKWGQAAITFDWTTDFKAGSRFCSTV